MSSPDNTSPKSPSSTESPNTPSNPSSEGPQNSPTDASQQSNSDRRTNSLADAQIDQRSSVDDHLDAARDCLCVERRILSDERAAFRSFSDRLLALDAPVATAAIEAHYRETVMAVPHYRSEYGDTFAQSVAVEFGSTIALDCGSNRSLEEPTVDAIEDAAQRCWRARDELVDLIDAEAHAVTTVAETLKGHWCSLESLDSVTVGESAVELRLAVLREQCNALARRRRTELSADATAGQDGDDGQCPAEVRPSVGGDGRLPSPDGRLADGDLQSLCYRDLDADRPVLVAIDELRQAIDRRRRAVIDRRSSGCETAPGPCRSDRTHR